MIAPGGVGGDSNVEQRPSVDAPGTVYTYFMCSLCNLKISFMKSSPLKLLNAHYLIKDAPTMEFHRRHVRRVVALRRPLPLCRAVASCRHLFSH